jgi:hypothetical protein
VNRELIITYLINFGYTLLKAVVYAIGCFVAYSAFDILDTKVNVKEQITEHKNLGWAIMCAAIFLGLAYVIGQI